MDNQEIKIEYYLGKKNKKTSYKIYKKIIKDYNPVNREHWWVFRTRVDKTNKTNKRLFVHNWNYCNNIPIDMKRISNDEALKTLFLQCL